MAAAFTNSCALGMYKIRLISSLPLNKFHLLHSPPSPPPAPTKVQAAAEVNTSLSEKYPSFEMVLSFVRSSTLTVERVQSLIQQRSQTARDMTVVCTLATDLLKTMFSDGIIEVQLNTSSRGHCTFLRCIVVTVLFSLQIPLLTFLQHLLLRQRCFPMCVNGCMCWNVYVGICACGSAYVGTCMWECGRGNVDVECACGHVCILHCIVTSGTMQ